MKNWQSPKKGLTFLGSKSEIVKPSSLMRDFRRNSQMDFHLETSTLNCEYSFLRIKVLFLHKHHELSFDEVQTQIPLAPRGVLAPVSA